MNSKDVGDRTEAIVIYRLLLMDFVVLNPIGDNRRYDIVLDINGKFIRGQCKTAFYRNGCVSFNTKSIYKKNGKTIHRQYTKDEIDFFFVYSHNTKNVYVVNVLEVPKSVMVLRVENPKQNYGNNIRWAKDYLIENWKVG